MRPSLRSVEVKKAESEDKELDLLVWTTSNLDQRQRAEGSTGHRSGAADLRSVGRRNYHWSDFRTRVKLKAQGLNVAHQSFKDELISYATLTPNTF